MKIPKITFEATANIDQVPILITRIQAGGFNQSRICEVYLWNNGYIAAENTNTTYNTTERQQGKDLKQTYLCTQNTLLLLSFMKIQKRNPSPDNQMCLHVSQYVNH